MGHTNYWKRTPELPVKAFAAAVADCKKLIKHLNVPIGGKDGTGSPIFRAALIAFNGAAPEDYETFVVERVNARFHSTQWIKDDPTLREVDAIIAEFEVDNG